VFAVRELIRLFDCFDFKIFAICLGFSIVWIVGTDYLVYEFASLEKGQLLQTVKGLTYVFIISLILSFFKRREKDTLKTAFAHKKQALLGEFSGMIVHEVKNPLHIISLAANKIETSDDKHEKTIELVKTSIQNLNQTIDFLQALSRGEDIGGVDFSQKCSLEKSINRVVRFIEKAKMEYGVEYEVNIPEKLSIEGNDGLLFHLFLNLLKNAIESFESQESGHWIAINSQVSGHQILLSIENSGKPINLLTQARLFKHFTSKKDSKGTGLGLLICRQIMRGHKGTISYDDKASHPRFVLAFPNPKI